MNIRRKEFKPTQRNYLSALHTVKGYVVNNNGTETDAEDIVQEAFLRLLEKFEDKEFELKKNPERLLYTIAKNIWIDKLREKETKRHEYKSEKDLNIIDNTLYEREIDEKKELKRQLVRSKIKMLDDNCRKIMECKLEGMSFDEIIEKLEFTNKKTVWERFYRCKLKLIKLISSDEKFEKTMMDG